MSSDAAVEANHSALYVPSASFALRRQGGMRMQVGKYGAVFVTSLQNHLAYLTDWLLGGVFLVMVLFIFLQLWRVTYGVQGRATIAGFTLPQMLWYLAITESIMLSRPRVNRAIDEEVRSGEIAYVLVRPYGYAGYRLATYLGERVLRFGTNLVFACAIAALYVGPVPFRAASVAAAVVALGLAMLIDFLGSFSVGLLAFWTEDTDSIALIYDRMVMLLGGMLLPLSALPPAISGVVQALPFSVLVYGPARLALGDPEANVATIFVKQGLALALFGAIAASLYAAARRRVTVNGG